MKVSALALAIFALAVLAFANTRPTPQTSTAQDRAPASESTAQNSTPALADTGQDTTTSTTQGGTPATAAAKPAPAEVGDKLERITCPKGYAAFVYATDLAAPDGLAFDTQGRLLVVEEGKGRITRIDKHGNHKILAEDLTSPEGLFTTKTGEIFVAEDARDGRLIAIDKRGKQTVLATHLDAPEGVILVGESLFVTESTAQLVSNKFTMKTRLIQLTRDKSENGWSEPKRLFERGLPLSLSELIHDNAGHILIANETAGGFVAPGLMSFDLETQNLEVFATGLISPEGLAWSASGSWPLFVAEEDVDAKEHGRLSTVSKDGKRTTFATGFGTLEDVLVTPDGHIFVSEDVNRQIVELRPLD